MNTAAPVDPRLRMKIIAAYAVIYLVWGSTFLASRLGVALVTLPGKVA